MYSPTAGHNHSLTSSLEELIPQQNIIVMGFIGLLLQIATAGIVIYMGYEFRLDYILLLLSPLGFMLGAWMRRLSKSGSQRRGFTQFISDVFSGYIVSLVIVAVLFGAGFALFHVLEQRPAEGTGRW